MSNPNILTEIPPISPQDCFVVFDRYKREFCYPVHIHQEYELNLVCGAQGATRIVGDSIREIGPLDLALITGSYLEHAWLNGNYACDADVHEVCIQFSPELFEKGFIDKKQFHPIRRMFEYAQRGIAFSEQTIVRAEPYFERLSPAANASRRCSTSWRCSTSLPVRGTTRFWPSGASRPSPTTTTAPGFGR